MLFDRPQVLPRELEVLGQILELHRAMGYATATPQRWTRVLRRMLIARAIQGSNSIEGYSASLDDVVAAAEGEEPLDANQETSWALIGYRQAMTYIRLLAGDPHFVYSTDLIRSLHYMMLQHHLDKSPGQWRSGPVYVHDDRLRRNVYEGPQAEDVADLMAALIEQLDDGDANTPPIVQAAMSHLNLVMIHPFRDGNGRMARALQTLVLGRKGILAPEFSSIEEYLGRNTPAYYDVLALVGQGTWHPENDARPWMRFCLRAHLSQARRVLRRSREGERLWDLLEQETRRHGLPERVVAGLWHAGQGRRLWRALYVKILADGWNDVSDVVATRDLKLCADGGILVPMGEKRGRFYLASARLRELREAAREKRIDEDEDPFAAG